MAFNTLDIESLRPSLQDTGVDRVLLAGVGEREAQVIHLVILSQVFIVLQKISQAICNIIEEFFPSAFS